MGGVFDVAIEKFAQAHEAFLRALEAKRQAWIATGNPALVVGALKLCHEHRQAPPPWVVIGTAMMQPQPTTVDIRDFIRWHFVKYGIKRRLTRWSDGACYDWAAAQLREYNGHESTRGPSVRKAYLEINRTLRSGDAQGRYPNVVILQDPPRR
jgi:hypothetical protein